MEKYKSLYNFVVIKLEDLMGVNLDHVEVCWQFCPSMREYINKHEPKALTNFDFELESQKEEASEKDDTAKDVGIDVQINELVIIPLVDYTKNLSFEREEKAMSLYLVICVDDILFFSFIRHKTHLCGF